MIINKDKNNDKNKDNNKDKHSWKTNLDTEIKGSELGHRWCENKWKYEKWRKKQTNI